MPTKKKDIHKPPILLITLLIITATITWWYLQNLFSLPKITFSKNASPTFSNYTVDDIEHPLAIKTLKNRTYQSPALEIEDAIDTKPFGRYYHVKYLSDGLTQYGLLTIPSGKKTVGGWPLVIFLHGYGDPKSYDTLTSYAVHIEKLTTAGFAVFKPDYRGHAQSSGPVENYYYSPAYIIDILNGINAIKKYPYINNKKIGAFAHSMGGHLLLKTMVVSKDIKAGVIWAGVVAPLPEVFELWEKHRYFWQSKELQWFSDMRHNLYNQFGEPSTTSPFWQAISPNTFLKDLSGILQIHHSTTDPIVPVAFSQTLHRQLLDLNNNHEYYQYEQSDHDLSGTAFDEAMTRSITFLKHHLL